MASEADFTRALAAFKQATAELERVWGDTPGVPADAIRGYPESMRDFEEFAFDVARMEVNHTAFAREAERARIDHAAYERGYRDAQQARAHDAERQRVKQDAAAYHRGYRAGCTDAMDAITELTGKD